MGSHSTESQAKMPYIGQLDPTEKIQEEVYQFKKESWVAEEKEAMHEREDQKQNGSRLMAKSEKRWLRSGRTNGISKNAVVGTLPKLAI